MQGNGYGSRATGARRIITIDGPAGTGKSVTARALAKHLGFLYLDSGALYRAIALAAEREGIETPRDGRLLGLLESVRIQARADAGAFHISVDNRDVSDEIRSERLGCLASDLATAPEVRTRVGELLHDLSRQQDCIAEGRDMGSEVFPEADLKIYLTASIEVRAQRRIAQLRDEGRAVNEERVTIEMRARDSKDRARGASPLRVPAGAIRLDTTDLTFEEQTNLICALYRGHGRLRGSRFYRCARGLARCFFIALGGVRVTGFEKIPKGAFLLASNHRSYFDGPLIGCLLPGATGFLAKEELFRKPLLGSLLRRLNAIPIRRGRMDRSALRAARSALRQALPLLIFPEGTRTKGLQLGKPHAGVAWLARQAHVPVVPARIRGDSFWRSVLRLEHIHVTFGDPLYYDSLESGSDDRMFAATVMQAIAGL